MPDAKVRFCDNRRYLTFRCPGCDDFHVVNVADRGRACWTWNGSEEAPTFQPSILVRSGHHVPWFDGGQCYCTWDKKDQEDFADLKCTICHSFVTDGAIQFLDDCTHHLKGQTVPLPIVTEPAQ